MLTGRSVDPPLPAAGYQLPIAVEQPDRRRQPRGADGERLRGGLAGGARAGRPPAQDRTFAVTALTQCAVLAARWSRCSGVWPITVAFPGGSE